MSYKLFLDDVREPPENWVCVRTYKEFCEIVFKKLPSEISFDIDLRDIHNGFHCAKYLQTILKGTILKSPIKIYCHSGSIFSVGSFIEDVLGENAIYMGRLC